MIELELPQNNKEELSWIQMLREMHRIGREKKLRKILRGWGLGDASIRKESATQA